jgi:hypothetical protein
MPMAGDLTDGVRHVNVHITKYDMCSAMRCISCAYERYTRDGGGAIFGLRRRDAGQAKEQVGQQAAVLGESTAVAQLC